MILMTKIFVNCATLILYSETVFVARFLILERPHLYYSRNTKSTFLCFKFILNCCFGLPSFVTGMD